MPFSSALPLRPRSPSARRGQRRPPPGAASLAPAQGPAAAAPATPARAYRRALLRPVPRRQDGRSDRHDGSLLRTRGQPHRRHAPLRSARDRRALGGRPEGGRDGRVPHLLRLPHAGNQRAGGRRRGQPAPARRRPRRARAGRSGWRRSGRSRCGSRSAGSASTPSAASSTSTAGPVRRWGDLPADVPVVAAGRPAARGRIPSPGWPRPGPLRAGAERPSAAPRPAQAEKAFSSFASISFSAGEVFQPAPRKPPAASATLRARPRRSDLSCSRAASLSVGEIARM